MKRLSIIITVALCVCAVSSCDFFPAAGDPDDPGKENNNGTEEIDWSDPAWYSTNFWDRTDREKAGLRGPVKKWYSDNYTTYDVYEYDVDGRLVKDTYVNLTNPDLGHECRYTYDAAGHRVKMEYFDNADGAGDYTIYEYENTGKYVAQNFFMMGPEIQDADYGIVKDLSRELRVVVQPYSSTCWEATYTFNADGNLVVKESSYELYEGSEERENEESFEYTIVYDGGYPKSLTSDKLRFNVVNITYYPNGMYKDFEYLEENAYNFDTGYDRHTYKMLDNPRYLAIESYDLGGTASYMSLTPKWMRRTYDEHFDIVRNDESYGSDPYVEGAEPTYTDTWKEYTHDKYGNWITRVETVIPRYQGGDGHPTTIRRTIEYYE